MAIAVSVRRTISSRLWRSVCRPATLARPSVAKVNSDWSARYLAVKGQ